MPESPAVRETVLADTAVQPAIIEARKLPREICALPAGAVAILRIY